MNKTINIPAPVLVKIAAFLDKVPAALEAMQTESAPVKTASESVKQASTQTVANLVKYAGLDSTKQAAFADFILTQEGSLKVINSLVTKLAEAKEEAANVRKNVLGGPDLRSKSASSGQLSGSSEAWCRNLM